MAKPITNVQTVTLTEEQKERQQLEQLLSEISKNPDGLKDTVKLLQELHNIGVLGAASAALEAKEKIVNILLGQVLRPNVTNLINHAMGAASVLGEMNPQTTEKLLRGLNQGLDRAEKSLEQQEKTGVFDLMKALKDPDVNRAVTFGINLLKGFGQGLDNK